MPDGHKQEPGGWNRIVLQVTDLENRIETLKKAGLSFRNEMESGPGGKQIQLNFSNLINRNDSDAQLKVVPIEVLCEV